MMMGQQQQQQPRNNVVGMSSNNNSVAAMHSAMMMTPQGPVMNQGMTANAFAGLGSSSVRGGVAAAMTNTGMLGQNNAMPMNRGSVSKG